MNDQELKIFLMKFCNELAKEDIDILMIVTNGENSRIAGTLCPVCALEELKDFIEEEEIEHNRGEVGKVH